MGAGGRALALLVLLLAAGTGCSNRSDRPTWSPGPGSSSASSSASGASSSGGQGGGGAASSGSGGEGAGGSGTSSGGDGGEGAALVPEIIDENLVVDCTLEAPEDPVSGGLTAQYDNKKGASPATATLLSCQLVMDAGPNKLTWSFDATPAQVAVEAGALETVEHVKTPGSGVGSGIGEPCDYCFKSWHLAAKWSIDGEIKSASSDPEGIFCEQ